eukprot:m.82968 g.82968  ORF g.82968 m.82968 type:complete len:514 (+) comp17685_c0_seq1:202-1743(+)
MADLPPPAAAATADELGTALKEASIVSHETQGEDKRYTVYKIELQTARKQKIIVFHRYSEFRELFDTLKEEHGKEANFPKFPGKRLLGSNFDKSFIESRQKGLQEFIQRVVSHPVLSRNKAVRAFLLGTPRHGRGHSRHLSDETPEEREPSPAASASPNHFDLGEGENKKATVSDFTMLKVIGKGNFGRVLLGMHKASRTIYAVKVLNKDAIIRQNEVKHIMSERNVLRGNVKHPFLVGLHYSFQTPTKLYFVLDFVNGGELFFHLQREKKFAPARAMFYAAEITSALTFLHTLNVVYRDLKPENILLDSEGHVKLTDFGLCKEDVAPGMTTATFCGTPEYLAPEVLKKQAYGRPVDWWCLGCVTYEMMCGLPPFYSRDCNEMYDRILHDTLRFPEHVPGPARAWLAGLLERNPAGRLGSGPRDGEDVKAHDFFADLDWDALEKRKVKPPFDPHVESEFDLRNFDPEFVNEPLPSPSAGAKGGMRACSMEVTLNVQADQLFDGFSYVGDSVLK